MISHGCDNKHLMDEAKTNIQNYHASEIVSELTRKKFTVNKGISPK